MKFFVDTADVAKIVKVPLTPNGPKAFLDDRAKTGRSTL
jgi:hypothetical protein